MRLNVTALGLTLGLIWGGAILVVGVANMIWPGYGGNFLDLTASIYPGHHPGSGVGSVIAGTLYGFVDGAIGGAVSGWLYNTLAGKCPGGSA